MTLDSFKVASQSESICVVTDFKHRMPSTTRTLLQINVVRAYLGSKPFHRHTIAVQREGKLERLEHYTNPSLKLISVMFNSVLSQ